jgi:hypothetical protein
MYCDTNDGVTVMATLGAAGAGAGAVWALNESEPIVSALRSAMDCFFILLFGGLV